MILLKYAKTGESAYLPHLDTMRQIIRTLRRAEIPVNYSLGYNPHMNLFFAPPIPVGLSSLSEYVLIDCTDAAAESVLFDYNACALKGLKGLSCTAVTKNPNIAALTKYARYEFVFDTAKKIQNFEVQGWASRDDIVLSFARLEKTITQQLAGKLLNAVADGEHTAALTLPCGNENVRADKLAVLLDAELALSSRGVQITRTNLFTTVENQLTDVDNFVDSHFSA